MTKRFIPVILLLLAEALSAAPLSPSEREALREWSHSAGFKGTLLTPPRGHIQPLIRRRQRYLEKMVEHATRGRLTGMHWVVNIYASATENAWIEENSQTNGSEKRWIEKHRSPWPIRSLLGVQDQNPILEIGVTTACWNKLEFEDELAILLKHEDAHHAEGHLTHRRGFQRWLSSQTHEAIADHLALKSQVGQYDLEALPSLIEKLEAQPYSHNWAMFTAGISTHHHIGERLALSQFYTQYLRHTHKEAQTREMIPLPDSKRLQNKLRVARNPKFLKWRHKFDNFVQHELLQGQISDTFMKMEDDGEYAIPEGQIPTFNQEVETIVEIWDLIAKADATKVNKVNAFLLVTPFLQNLLSVNQAHFWEVLAGPGNKSLVLQRTTRMLAQNSLGPDGWKFSDFKPYADKLMAASVFWIDDFLFSSLQMQDLLRPLVEIFPEWDALLSDAADLNHFRKAGKLESDKLGSRLNCVLNNDKGSLYQLYTEKILASFAQFTPHELLEHETQPGYASFTDLYNLFDPESPPERDQDPLGAAFFEKLQMLLKPTYDLFEAGILNKAQAVFSKPGHLEEKTGILAMLDGNLSHLAPFRTFMPDFIRFARDQFSADPTDLYDTFVTFTVPMLLDTTEQLINPRLTKSDKIVLLKLLGVLNTSNFEDDSPEQTSIRSHFKDYFTSLSAAEFKELVLTRPSGANSLYQKMVDELPQGSRRQFGKLWRQQDDELAKGERFQDLTQYLFDSINNTLYFAHVSGGDERFVRETSLSDIEEILDQIGQIEALSVRVGHAMSRRSYGPGAITTQSGSLLINAFIEHMEEARDLRHWQRIFSKLQQRIFFSIVLPSEQQQKIEAYISKQFTKMSHAERYGWLRRQSMQRLLSSRFVGRELADYVRTFSKAQWATHARRVLEQTRIKDTFSDAYFVFRNHLVESERLQPKEVLAVFPEDPRTLTERTSGLHVAVRGVSALTAALQERPADDQIEAVEYLMGRRSEIPRFLKEFEKDHMTSANSALLNRIFERARAELDLRTPLERSFVISSVLSGPDSLLMKPGGLDFILDHILTGVSDDIRDFVRIVAEDQLEVEGRNKPLILAYVLSQKSSGAQLSDGHVITSFIDFYGAFGTSFAQYLAFTRAFERIQAHVEPFQDQAMKPALYDALMVVAKYLPEWPEDRYPIIGIEGSGKANLALRYLNRETHEEEILNILRDEIETKTAEDFRRGKLLLEALTRRPEYRDRFDFAVGLLNIVRSSVELEFDKPHAYQMQKQFHRIYRHQVNGWRVQSVEPIQLLNRAIRLKKAKGIVAREMANTDPDTYNEALGAFVLAEFDVLRGVDGEDSLIPLHGNPDIHDGQLYIDLPSRVVSVIDPAQALMISSNERELALELLQIVSGTESVASSLRILRKRFGSVRPEGLAQALAKESRMSRFVHLISWLSRHSIEPPLSSIHWVLGMHRLMLLGARVGQPVEPKVTALLVLRKAGMGLSTFNKLNKPVPKCPELFTQQ